MGYPVSRMMGTGPQEAYWRQVDVGELHRRVSEFYPVRRTRVDQGIDLGWEQKSGGFAAIDQLLKTFETYGLEPTVFLFEVASEMGLVVAPWKGVPEDRKLTETKFIELRQKHLQSGDYRNYGPEYILKEIRSGVEAEEAEDWRPPALEVQTTRVSPGFIQAMLEAVGIDDVQVERDGDGRLAFSTKG